MKKSLGVFPQEDANSLKEALLTEGIVSEINPTKYISEDNLKYMPVFTGRFDLHPELNAPEKASALEVLVEEKDLDLSKKIQESLGIVSIEEDISKLKNKLNLSQNTLDKAEDFLKAFQLTGADMDRNDPSRSGAKGYLNSNDTAFINFIFNQKTKDYFKSGLGRKLFISFILEVIISVFLFVDPFHWLPANAPTGFILLVLVWSGLMIMSFPYRERFGPKITKIYIWIVNIMALLALAGFIFS